MQQTKKLQEMRPDTSTKERKCATGLFMFGLHPIWNISRPGSQKPLPLERIDIKINIHQSVARVEFTQIYVNNSKDLLETEYFFPIPYDACFDSFRASYEGNTITGVIKEKKKAKEEYIQNVSQGNTTAYVEINEQTNDIMKVNIGNIKPSTRIEITFSYLQQVEIIRNSLYAFTFHSTFTRRYRAKSSGPNWRKIKNGDDNESFKLATYPFLSFKQGPVWSLEVTVTSKSPITHFECISHKTESEAFDNPCHKKIRIVPSSDELVFDKDFILYYSESDFNIPNYRLAKNEAGYCVMVEFVPKFSDKTSDEVIQSQKLQVKQVIGEEDEEMNLMNATGEYIFLIDRSGSMQGARIEMAKEALLFALKSLPPNSHFNVISFGGGHKKLFPASVESNEKNIKEAVEAIRNFYADMGGTEILNPLLFALTSPRIKYHPRSIFLLTDGAVNNTNVIINQIGLYNHRNRVFTLGIGNGCSTELVYGCAEVGKGKAQFVSDSKEIIGSVISLMSAAVVPVCDDFSLQFSDKSCVRMIAPDPTSHTHLLRNERATFFVFLENSAIEKGRNFEISLRCFDSFTNNYFQNVMTVDLEDYETSLDVFKLGISKVASVLNKREQGLSKEAADIYWAGKTSIDEEMVKMSVANQVLTKKTAFICVVAENGKDEMKGLKKVKEIVPQVLSSDYKINLMKYSGEEHLLNIRYKRKMPTSSTLSYSGGAVEKASPQNFNFTAMPRMASTQYPDGGLATLEKKTSASMNLFRSSSKIQQQKMPEKESISINYLETVSEGSKASTSDSKLLDVIQNQKVLGYWEATKEILQVIGLKEEELLKKASTILKGVSETSLSSIAITLVILVWLEKYYQNMKSGWIMIHKKGQQWLKAQGVKYAEVQSQIDFI